jgi:hypothetical protein
MVLQYIASGALGKSAFGFGVVRGFIQASRLADQSVTITEAAIRSGGQGALTCCQFC